MKPVITHVKHFSQTSFLNFKKKFKDHGLRYIFMGIFLFVFSQKDLQISIKWDTNKAKQAFVDFHTGPKIEQSLEQSLEFIPQKTNTKKQKLDKAYIKRFVNVAQKEMKTFQIPASITLAQGLLETNAGQSNLAKKHNNHFGIKCFSRTCKRGHCVNLSDDSHKDFFRKYDSAWEAYRDHSSLLQKPHYKNLHKIKSTDYKSWAKGLASAGYATDKKYAEKLILLIEKYQLYKYDN